MSKSRTYILLVTFVAACALGSSAAADEGQGPRVDTTAPDLGYGEQPLAAGNEFETPEALRGRVDERYRLNPLADRTIGWSTGYIPPQGSVTLSNQAIYGQRIGVSVTDDIQLFGHAFLPLGSQTYAGGGGQMHVAGDDAWDLTVGVQGRYRRTNFRPGTSDIGAGVHAVFDVIATDNTSWNAGVSAHIPIYHVVEEVDLSRCDNRREWAEGACAQTEAQPRTMPTSGYWASLFAGVNHFATDWLILNAEAFTGVSQGNFWALESALDTTLAYNSERQLVEDTSFSGGLGPLGLLTVGLGSTWVAGPVALQTSLYFTNYDGNALVLPHMTLGVGF